MAKKKERAIVGRAAKGQGVASAAEVCPLNPAACSMLHAPCPTSTLCPLILPHCCQVSKLSAPRLSYGSLPKQIQNSTSIDSNAFQTGSLGVAIKKGAHMEKILLKKWSSMSREKCSLKY